MSKLNHIINRFYYFLLLFQSNYNNKTFINKGLNFGILSKNGFPLNICTVGYFKSLSKSVAFEPPPQKKGTSFQCFVYNSILYSISYQLNILESSPAVKYLDIKGSHRGTLQARYTSMLRAQIGTNTFSPALRLFHNWFKCCLNCPCKLHYSSYIHFNILLTQIKIVQTKTIWDASIYCPWYFQSLQSRAWTWLVQLVRLAVGLKVTFDCGLQYRHVKELFISAVIFKKIDEWFRPLPFKCPPKISFLLLNFVAVKTNFVLSNHLL